MVICGLSVICPEAISSSASRTKTSIIVFLYFVETNPVPVKAALAMMGRMEARYRLPLVPLDAANEPRLRHTLAEAGLLEAETVG